MQSFIFKNIISKIYNIYFSINAKVKAIDINKNSRCLMLTTNYEDMLFSCAGLLLQNNDLFEVNCLTNGFRNILDENFSYEEKIKTRNNEFTQLMDAFGISLYKFFNDIDDNRLGMRYDKFSSINISDFDYIFIPNITEQNRDVKSLIFMLKELLKEKAHKPDLKIIMYEGTTPLAMANSYIDITDNIDKKTNLLKNLKSQIIRDDYSEISVCLNKYRGAGVHKNYAEAFCVLSVNEFKNITKVLN